MLFLTLFLAFSLQKIHFKIHDKQTLAKKSGQRKLGQMHFRESEHTFF